MVQVPIIKISRRWPGGIRHFLYFWRLLRLAKDCDVICVFNLISCAVPACLSAKLLRKKFLIRVGGDFLWERAVERGSTKKPLKKYYQEPKRLKEKFWILIIKKILHRADRVIFSSNFQREIYFKNFGIKKEKTSIISNPFPEIDFFIFERQMSNIKDGILLYAGRLLKLKNLDMLIRAFKKTLVQSGKDLTLKIIGEGPEKKNLRLKVKGLKLEDRVIFEEPLPHQELLEEIQKSYLCVLPSLTEISPNFALECLKLQKPILLTKETGYYESFKEVVVFIDPEDEKDLSQKLLYLLNEKTYKDYIDRIRAISTSYSWPEVAEKYIVLFKSL